MSRGIAVVVFMMCIAGTGTCAGTGEGVGASDAPFTPDEVERQIAEIDVRLRNQQISDLDRYNLALRKARLRRITQASIIGSKGNSSASAPATQPTRASPASREEGLPSLLGQFSQLIGQYESQLRRQPLDLTAAQQWAWVDRTTKATDTTLKGMVDRRFSVAGTVAEVQAQGQRYNVSLTYPAGPRRLTRDEQTWIANCREAIRKHKRYCDELRSRGKSSDIPAWIAVINHDKDTIARIQAESRERIPKHLITVLTADPKALELRKGWGLSTAATFNSGKLQSVKIGDAPQYYIAASVTAEKLGPISETVEDPDASATDEDLEAEQAQ